MVVWPCVETKPGYIGRVEKRFSVVSNMDQQAPHDLDFDGWAQLATDDPESFEATRQAAIEELIQSFPQENRERMRRLQWRIDQERRLAKSPMGSCIRLSKMMWQQLLGNGGLRERLSEFAQGLQGGELNRPPEGVDAKGRVLVFARPVD